LAFNVQWPSAAEKALVDIHLTIPPIEVAELFIRLDITFCEPRWPRLVTNNVPPTAAVVDPLPRQLENQLGIDLS
jgi:hypothetical protein